MKALRIGILGGSFNPVHIGHVRLAIEARELLQLDRVDLVPAAVPPHKSGQSLLPFGLRCRLLRRAVAGLPGLGVNLTEACRRGPSYTWDTLAVYGQEFPGARLFFFMGVPDLATLPTWRHGLELPCRADLAVVARQGMAEQEAQDLVRRFWPGASGPARLTAGGEACLGDLLEWQLPGAGRLILLNPPLLEISATQIRSYWRQGRELRCLIPRDVAGELTRKQRVVERFWREGYDGGG